MPPAAADEARPAEARPSAPAPKSVAPAPEGAERAALVPPQPKPEPKPEPRIRPADLIGLTDARLAEVLGSPAFKRMDDPAALWQYRGTRCILDLFLYADGPAYRVTHMEFRKAAGGGAAGEADGVIDGEEADRCFADLLPKAQGKG